MLMFPSQRCIPKSYSIRKDLFQSVLEESYVRKQSMSAFITDALIKHLRDCKRSF